MKHDGQRLRLSTGHGAALTAKTYGDFIRFSIRLQPSRTKGVFIVLCGGGVVCLFLPLPTSRNTQVSAQAIWGWFLGYITFLNKISS